jgi:hypothetical protein
MTAWASALVVERMPEAKFVKAAKGIELVVLGQRQWRRRGHECIITKRSGIDNRSANWRAYRLNPDLGKGDVGAAVSSRKLISKEFAGGDTRRYILRAHARSM